MVPTFTDGDSKITEQLKEEGFKLLVGAVKFVDEQRPAPVRFPVKLNRLEQRAADHKFRAKNVFFNLGGDRNSPAPRGRGYEEAGGT